MRHCLGWFMPLAVLAKHRGKAISFGELCSEVDAEVSRVRTIMRSLVSNQLVSVDYGDPEGDRRLVIYEITDDGMKLLDQFLNLAEMIRCLL